MKSDSKRKFTRQFLAAFTGTLFAISDGIAYGWTSPMIPYLISSKSHIKTTIFEAEWLETCLLLGAFTGLPLTIYSVDKFGRKKSLLFASITIFIGWMLIGFGNKMIYLFIGRFLCGIAGDMAFVACPMYMAEISDPKIRGLLSGIVYIMVHIGTLLVYSIGPFFPYITSPLLAALFVTLQLIFFYFVPESPYYLIYKNKQNKARKALKFFKPYKEADMEIQEVTEMLEKQKLDRGRPQDLFLVKSNRKAFTIMAVLNTGQHLCAYTAILMNLHLILESAGSIYIESSKAAILFAGIMLISAGFATFRVDKYGRRVLLMISSIASGCCVLLLAIYFHLKSSGVNMDKVSWIPIVSVMIYGCFFKLGVGLVPIIVTAEIFPSNMKAIGMTMADAMFIIGGLMGIQIYHLLSRYFGLFVPFYFFGFYAFFVAIFTYCYIPETKGKSLDEIQTILKG